MPPEARLLSLGAYLPGAPIDNEVIARQVGGSAAELLSETDIQSRHHAGAGEGPSDLARRAAETALVEAEAVVADLGLIVFATATPDVTFPGSACYLQDKLGAGTVGAVDVRAQSAGFLAGLDLALSFASVPGALAADGAPRILVAAGEVLSTGLDESPNGRDLTPRFGDGAAAAVVGEAAHGTRVAALRWYTDGAHAEDFWCEFPASRRYPLRIMPEDLAAGRHYPRANLEGLAPIVEERLGAVGQEVLDAAGWGVDSLNCAIVDYVEPRVARAAANAVGVANDRVDVPTEHFGHVMSAGLPLRLAVLRGGLAPGSRVLLAAAGPGLAWGAAALEMG